MVKKIIVFGLGSVLLLIILLLMIIQTGDKTDSTIDNVKNNVIEQNPYFVYTNNSKKECVGNKCTVTSYSEQKYYKENDNWKTIEEVNSLKNQGLRKKFLKQDVEFPLNVTDFNMTSITVSLKSKNKFNQDIPIRIWRMNETKRLTYEYEKSLIINTTNPNYVNEDYYKNISDLVLSDSVNFEPNEKEENKTYIFGRYYFLEFGFNSTVVYSEYNNASGGTASSTDSTTQWLSQSITIGANGLNETFFIDNIRLRLGRTNNPNIATVSLRVVNSTGQPSGADLTSGTINATAVVTTDSAGLWYNFSVTPYQVNAGEKYGIVLKSSGGAGDTVNWIRDSDTYTGGLVLLSTNSGVSWNDFNTIDFKFEVIGYQDTDSSPNVTLNSPVNYYNSSSQTVDINCSASDNNIVENVSLYIDDVLNFTVVDGVNNATELFKSITFADGSYNWTCASSDNASLQGLTYNRTITIDSTSPIINIIYPTDTLYDVLIDELNYTIDDTSEVCSLETYSCYQEFANVTTTCGGLSTGNYYVANNYFYINYTIPSNASGESYWVIKHGNLSAYNTTLNSQCWYSSTLQLRVYSASAGGLRQSYGQCYNNTAWINTTEATVGGVGGSVGNSGNDERLYDGDWGTEQYFVVGFNDWYNSGNEDSNRIFEEAMLWSNRNNSNLTSSGLNYTDLTSYEGTNLWTVYCNDSLNNIGSDSVSFFIDTINPTIVLFSPANDSQINNNVVTFNCSSTDNLNTKNLTLVVDDVVKQTVQNTTASQLTLNMSYQVSGLTFGIHNWTCKGSDRLGNYDIASLRTFNITTESPVITLNSPVNYYNSSLASVSLNCSGNDTNNNIMNLSLFVDDVLEETVYNTTTSQEYLNLYNTQAYSEALHNWTCSATDGTNIIGTITNKYFRVDLTEPFVNQTGLTDQATYILPTSVTWGINATDSGSGLSDCYYNYTGNTTYRIVDCNTNTVTNFTIGGLKTFYYCANDTAGNINCTSTIINIVSIIANQTATPNITGEGQNVIFTLDIESASIPSTSSATLYFNGTAYTNVEKITGTNFINFSKTLIVPYGLGNETGKIQNWYWKYTVTGYAEQTMLTGNITVFNFSADDCSTLNEQILNFTLKQEKENTIMSLVNRSSLIEVDINISSWYNDSISFNYHNSWVNDTEALICVPSSLLNYSDYKIDVVVEFEAEDYVHEFYYIDNGTLDNSSSINSFTSKTINLMDLVATDSTTCLGSYFNIDDLSESNIIIHTFRKYTGDGVFREVERSKEDDSGETHMHLVEEDVIYYFLVSKNSVPLYTSGTYNAKVTSSLCQIVLQASGDYEAFSDEWDLMTDGSYLLTTNRTGRSAILSFTSSTPATMNLTVYRYENDGTYTSVGSSQTLATSGTLSVAIPNVAGNVSFFAVAKKDDSLLTSKWLDLSQIATDYMSVTLALFLSFIILLVFALMGATSGILVIPIFLVGIFVVTALGLLVLPENNLGYALIIYLLCSGALLIYKLARSKK